MFKRLITILKAKFSRALDRVEDPGEVLDYSYEKQLEQIQNFRRGLTQLVASKKQLQNQCDAKRKEIVKLEAGARSALAAGNEDLARRALERKQLVAGEMEGLDQQVAELQAQQEQMAARERELRDKVARFRTRKEVTKAQYAAARAQVSASEAAVGISGQLGDSGLAMQRALDKVGDMQARAGALAELEQSGVLADLDSSETALDRQIRELVADTTVEKEMARMKREISSSPEQAQLPAGSQPPVRTGTQAEATA